MELFFVVVVANFSSVWERHGAHSSACNCLSNLLFFYRYLCPGSGSQLQKLQWGSSFFVSYSVMRLKMRKWDKKNCDGSLRRRGREGDMPLSRPSGGCICWGPTSANSRKGLIKTYITWHQWSQCDDDTRSGSGSEAQDGGNNHWLRYPISREIIVLFYWVQHDAEVEFKQSDYSLLASCILRTMREEGKGGGMVLNSDISKSPR